MRENLDIYRHNSNYFSFYQSYINNIQKSKPFQFICINSINIYTCYSYLEVFKDLILVEKAIITYIHLIIFIIKLKPDSINIFAFYFRICRQITVLSQ